MVEPISLTIIDPRTVPEVLAFYQQSLAALEFATARVIQTAEDMKPASDDLNLIRKLKRVMENRRKDYLEPFQAHIKEVNDAYKQLLSPVEAADKITSEKMLAFTAEQNRIRQEQERINAERIKLAEAEMRLKGELIESVKLVEVLPPTPATIRTELGSTGLRDNWQFEVVDFTLLPDEYKIVDAVKLGKVVRAGLRTIPGVRVFNQPSIVSRNK